MKKRIGREKPYGHETHVNSRRAREFTQGAREFTQGLENHVRAWGCTEILKNLYSACNGSRGAGCLGMYRIQGYCTVRETGGCEVSLCVWGFDFCAKTVFCTNI